MNTETLNWKIRQHKRKYETSVTGAEENMVVVDSTSAEVEMVVTIGPVGGMAVVEQGKSGSSSSSWLSSKILDSVEEDETESSVKVDSEAEVLVAVVLDSGTVALTAVPVEDF